MAIMGLTGSGKSSVINLISRFYDCSSGKITIDGVDIKDWPLGLLREQVSVVMQETFLFSDTILENIQFGSPDTQEGEIMTAAKDAKVDEFVSDLPDGYNTVIGERGIGLSGGEKQRVALARALVKKSPLLILDDATSNLDMETEYQIQRALEKRSGMTKFIVAHRISAVKNADEIIFIENGEIVERGTHWQLLALQKRYYEIYREQFQGILELKKQEA